MRNRHYQGPASDHFDGSRFFIPGHPMPNTLRGLLRWQFGGDQRARWPLQVPSPFEDRPPPRSDELRVALIGHASFLVQVAGLNILIDPVFSERVSPFSTIGPKRVNAPGIRFEALPPIDFVLVSHAHYDHLDSVSLARLEAAFHPRFVCPLGNDGIIARATRAPSRIVARDWGEEVDAGQGVGIHLRPSYHWSARGLHDRRMQLWCAFVLTTPQGTLYHIADTGYGDGGFFRQVKAEFGTLRLAHIPIGAYEPRWFMSTMHVNPEESVRILADCGARQAIGHHWGTFQLTNEAHGQPEQDLAAARAAQGLSPDRFVAFRPGQVWSG